MTNLATKMACDMVGDRSKSKNPDMTDLISKVTKTVYQVKNVEVMGSLFQALCEMLDKSSSSDLLNYRSHRFMGLVNVIERILSKWWPLCLWYQERQQKALREKKEPQEFPLYRERTALIQLLSLLEPIQSLNKRGMKELDVTQALKGYRSTAEKPMHIMPSELTLMVARTRNLLAQALDKNFFCRYTDREKLCTCSYIFEMQMFLHPVFNHQDGALTKMIRFCNVKVQSDQATSDYMVRRRKSTIIEKIRKFMLPLSGPLGKFEAAFTEHPHYEAYSAELLEMFAVPVCPDQSQQVREDHIDEEINRWQADTSTLSSGENVLHFWKRHTVARFGSTWRKRGWSLAKAPHLSVDSRMTLLRVVGDHQPLICMPCPLSSSRSQECLTFPMTRTMLVRISARHILSL
ncbi:TPA: hypothetical protein N0F65_007342 [Lagenidium giganteum]|uniref:Uncharacterized protein n=1 Tax=Lagenidium giganteum TaxID=4803 RepID=A0AAV2YHS0_9STRA|nr:TPA: hypothetical protein N0F65_007342 [Lagenidium giganteum]